MGLYWFKAYSTPFNQSSPSCTPTNLLFKAGQARGRPLWRNSACMPHLLGSATRIPEEDYPISTRASIHNRPSNTSDNATATETRSGWLVLYFLRKKSHFHRLKLGFQIPGPWPRPPRQLDSFPIAISSEYLPGNRRARDRHHAYGCAAFHFHRTVAPGPAFLQIC